MRLSARLAAALSLATATFASALAWGRLPERVPLHFNLRGEPNGWGSPLQAALLLPLLILGIWVFEELQEGRAVRRADASATEAERQGSRPVVVAVILLLLAAMHVTLLLQSLGLLREPRRTAALLLAAFLLVLGNFIGRLRPSYFVGIRTPWTLSSDAVWRRTHRFAGWLMVPAGLLALLSTLVLPPAEALPAVLVLFMLACAVPVLVSYVWVRRGSL